MANKVLKGERHSSTDNMPKTAKQICILRLGHRRLRDQRITTHVFLSARALGASEGVLCGERDDSVVEGVHRVSELWGGEFQVTYVENWQKFLKQRKADGWTVVHLTMYGPDFETVIRKNRASIRKCVVVVGAGKVPHAAYELADFNVSVTNQPHSEVAALALFIDRFFGGREMKGDFSGKLKIIPKACGKLVVRGENR
jgi:tRNA (cytidine56-2'-O)-methyltransferase